jgi:hypothetical protein
VRGGFSVDRLKCIVPRLGYLSKTLPHRLELTNEGNP